MDLIKTIHIDENGEVKTRKSTMVVDGFIKTVDVPIVTYCGGIIRGVGDSVNKE